MTFVNHPKYSVSSIANDVALIKLPSPINYTDVIRPACLPLKSSINQNLTNTYMVASGWGKTSDSNDFFLNQKKTLSFNHVIFSDSTISQILNKLTVRVVSNEECVSTFGSIIQVTNMCAIGSVKASGTCQGDSGSSLQYAIDTKRWAQVGVVSFGSATGCADDHPNGYTRIAHYLGWISEVTGIIYD